jgi:hypothetical protein
MLETSQHRTLPTAVAAYQEWCAARHGGDAPTAGPDRTRPVWRVTGSATALRT